MDISSVDDNISSVDDDIGSIQFGSCAGTGRTPYKQSTFDPPEDLCRSATPWRPANPQPLGGTEVGCKVDLQRLASFEPTLMIILCATWCSASLVLAPNNRPDASNLPPAGALGQLPA